MRKNKALKVGIIVFIVIVIIVVGLFIAKKMIVKKAAHIATDKFVEKMVNDDNSELTTEQKEKIKNTYDNLPAKDKDEMEKIVAKHIDAGTVKKALGYMKSGNKEALKDMAKKLLTEEEKQKLVKILRDNEMKHNNQN